MSSYPLGGLGIQNNDVGAVELFDTVFDNLGSFVPTTSDRLYPKGTVLARLTESSATLTPYIFAAITGLTDPSVNATMYPVAVLGSDVQATGVVAVPLRVIVSGQVRESKLTQDGAPPTVLTDVDIDRLRQTGIIALTSLELSKLDNQ